MWFHILTDASGGAADLRRLFVGTLDQPPEFYRFSGLHDPLSAASHLVGAAAFVVLGQALLRRGRGDAARLAYLGVYSFACVFLLLMSGMYHMTGPGTAFHGLMLRLDH